MNVKKRAEVRTSTRRRTGQIHGLYRRRKSNLPFVEEKSDDNDQVPRDKEHGEGLFSSELRREKTLTQRLVIRQVGDFGKKTRPDM